MQVCTDFVLVGLYCYTCGGKVVGFDVGLDCYGHLFQVGDDEDLIIALWAKD